MAGQKNTVIKIKRELILSANQPAANEIIDANLALSLHLG